MSNLTDFFRDRIQLNSALIVLCFVSVLLLESQSAASYPAYFLALAMLLTVRQWNDVFRTRLIWLVVALLGFLCASSFWSEPFSWYGVASIFTRGLMVFCFVVALAECQLRGQVQRWLGRALAIAGGIAATAAIVIYVLDVPEDGRLRGLGQLDNAVVAGLIFGVVFILLLDTAISERTRVWRVMAAGGSVFVLSAIVLSGSRNAWMSVFFGSIVFLSAVKVQDRQKFLAAMAALALVVGIVLSALYAQEDTRELLLPRGDSFRPDIWSTLISDVWTNHGIVGKGIETADSIRVGNSLFEHPHNMYLAVFFQGGMVAIILLLILIVGALRSLFENYDLRYAKLSLGILTVALCSYLLDGHELIDKVGETWFLFWLPIGLSVGVALGGSLRDG